MGKNWPQSGGDRPPPRGSAVASATKQSWYCSDMASQSVFQMPVWTNGHHVVNIFRYQVGSYFFTF